MTRPRVLYLAHRVPFPPDKGDRIRNYYVLCELARHADVWLAALADEPVLPEHLAELHRLCSRVELIPAAGKSRWLRAAGSFALGRSLSEGLFSNSKLKQLVRDWARTETFDASLVSASSLTPYQRLPELNTIPAHVDLVDVDSQKWFDFAEVSNGPKKIIFRSEGTRVRKLECEIAGWAKSIHLVSRAEVDLFNSYSASGKATHSTNGVNLDYFRPQPEVAEQIACVFVGAMDYFPNVDAAIWYAISIWPAIRKRHPDAEFRIVGRKPTASVLKLQEIPGVRVLGGVPDVRPHVASSMVAVCPIRLARGLQNKVLEALAMGKATIAGAPAIAALKVQVGRDLLSPNSESEWIDAVSELFSNAERRAELGRAGRAFAEENHDWIHCLKPFRESLFGQPRPV